ncbi:hypothetical protein [Streptomyces beihaiensis]|uniref:Uncharacterized protein n=1 Tax=Streptomyces beihaiensis TaxID=2984495 RepID=A0ABT3TR97_9ACTN|nr:hypothetical protein [Streptomyces beihaiensis]MCX3059572.1 hypothetical protein [Streptomyces beihaiensis]
MDLGDLITTLEVADPTLVVQHGFANPHSYRGDYMDLAFEPAESITVGGMLAAARSALGATYEGWKGGQYTMGEHTWCWLSQEGDASGETISPLLLEYILADIVEQPAAAPSTPAECRFLDHAGRLGREQHTWVAMEQPAPADAQVRGVQAWMALDLHQALGRPIDHTAEHQGHASWTDWWADLIAATRTAQMIRRHRGELADEKPPADRAAVVREAVAAVRDGDLGPRGGMSRDYENGWWDSRAAAEERVRRLADEAQPAEVVHVVADSSDDPEHVDDCPGCETQPEPEQLVHVGWWCWRGDNHGHLATTACRSDNVPLYVPAEWADEMRAVIQCIEDGDDEAQQECDGCGHAPHPADQCQGLTFNERCECDEPLAAETCRAINVANVTVTVRGSGNLTEQEQDYLAEIVRAAKRRYAAEHPEPQPVRPIALATPCLNCPHPYNWHASRGACEAQDGACGCTSFEPGERPTAVNPRRILGAWAQPADETQQDGPRCTCAVAGDSAVPLGHYADCPQAGETQQDEVVHACPPDGSGLTPCCGLSPFELPLTDRISSEETVTCTGPATEAQQDGAQP